MNRFGYGMFQRSPWFCSVWWLGSFVMSDLTDISWSGFALLIMVSHQDLQSSCAVMQLFVPLGCCDAFPWYITGTLLLMWSFSLILAETALGRCCTTIYCVWVAQYVWCTRDMRTEFWQTCCIVSHCCRWWCKLTVQLFNLEKMSKCCVKWKSSHQKQLLQIRSSIK